MFDLIALPYFLSDRNPIFFYLAIVPGIAFLLSAIVGAIIMVKFRLERSWLFALVAQITGDILLSLGLIGAIAFLIDDIFLAIAIVLVFVGYVQLHKNFIQHKPRSWILFKLSLLEVNGVVVEKHVHSKYYKIKYLREWVIIRTNDNQLIKAYVTSEKSIAERHHLQSFNVGDTGTLHYRKGKKYCYFDAFWPESDETDCESSEG